jgi:hypothetical protein
MMLGRAFSVLACFSALVRPADAGMGILVEQIELDAARATEILQTVPLGERRSALDGDLETGAAIALEVGYLVVRSGQRAGLRFVHEHIYPIEFDPAELKPSDASQPTVIDIVSTAPIAFEMRPVGQTLDVEAQRNEGMVDLAIKLDQVSLRDELTYGKAEAEVTMPNFESRVVKTRVGVELGGSALVAACRSKDPRSGRMVMVFVSVWDLGEDVHPPKIEDPFKVAEAGDDVEGGGVRMAVGVTHYELPLTDLRRVLNGGITLADVIDLGAAKPLVSLKAATMSGQRVKVEDSHEFIYRTEFDPGDFPRLDETVEQRLRRERRHLYEMRNIGASVEIDAMALGGVVSLEVFSERVGMLRMLEYGKGENRFEQPLFESARIEAAIQVPPSEAFLVGAYTPLAEDGSSLSDKAVIVVARAVVD